MNRWLAPLALTPLALALLVAACDDEATGPTEAPPEPADLIFRDGAILTLENGVVEALAVRGAVIVAVGDEEEIASYQGPDTRVAELAGRALLPGFVEGHTHVLRFPDRRGLTLDQAMDTTLRYGYTSVAELAASRDQVEQVLAAEADERLRLRVNLYPEYNAGVIGQDGGSVFVGAWFPGNPPITDPTRRVRIPGVKIFVDGAFVPGRGCLALTEPFPEEFRASESFQSICLDSRGDLYLEPDELSRVVVDIQEAGFAAAMHAMGDRAIDAALDAVDAARQTPGGSGARHQIHHSSVLRPDQIQRYRELDVLASVRGYFNTCYQDWYEYWYGPDRFEWAANRYALPGAGVRAFAEGDFGWHAEPGNPSTSSQINPLITLWGLVTHRHIHPDDGRVCEPAPWIARHRIGVERALRMLTVDAAYASGMEEHVGTLRPGKLADLVILDRSPLAVDPDEIPDLEVLMTMVGGVVEYCREECIVPGAEE